YWLAILLTFALGTAASDLLSEQFGLGYLATGILFTRPLGASVGDLLSQPGDYGGFGLGAVVTSAPFLAVIALTVVYMTVSRYGVEAA
ncbi:MAG: hypothetical protein H7317_03545, partial [Pseudorhodobacter sp.]|nr:hypothetical protein [Pseudorhodobacter sp.]